jgi:hypothetical protein
MRINSQTMRHREQICTSAPEQSSAMAIENFNRRSRYGSHIKHI